MDRKRKIAVIGLKGLPPFGGAANVGDNLIEQLSGKYDFTVYATASHTAHKGDYKGAHQIVFARFPIKRLNIFYYYLASAIHAVFAGRYDGVHLHQMDGAFTLLLLRLRYKVVATSHGITYTNSKWSKWTTPYFKANEWFQARLSSRLTVVSRSLIGHYARIVAPERITYIPNGITLIPPPTDTPAVAEASAKTATPYLLFAAGRIIPIKGLHFLLSALHLIGYRGKLIVLGDMTQMKDYAQQQVDLAAGLDVEFKGLVKDKGQLNAYIAGSTLFIFPSTIEAMSMMLLEVAALRTPVICSDIVQNTDVFDRNEMLFFRSESETDLADKLNWALGHPEEIKTFAKKAWQTLMAKYQWQEIARQYDNLFESTFNP
jgi:glycosyltransferase involved in cell wall biosynthesis